MVAALTVALVLALAPPADALSASPPSPAPRTDETLPAPFAELVPTRVPSTIFDDIVIFTTKGALRRLDGCGLGECFSVVLEKGGRPVCLQYDDGPSADPTFSIFAPVDVCKKAQVEWPDALWSAGARRIVIPGHGALYSAGHTNTLFNTRRKFEVKGRQITEVKQPFFYVGRTTTVTRQPFHDDGTPIPPVLLRAERDRKSPVVASLPEGAEVEIVLAVGGNSPWFLVKTSLGLLGWHESKAGGAMPDELGIQYAGD